MFVGVPHDLLLQSDERALSFAVEKRHIDAKDAQKTVGQVLLAGCLARRGSAHALGDAHEAELVHGETVTQELGRNAGPGGNDVPKTVPAADQVPGAAVKVGLPRGDEFL